MNYVIFTTFIWICFKFVINKSQKSYFKYDAENFSPIYISWF